MKIIIDINGSGKTCGGCEYRIKNIPVKTFIYGIPIKPYCVIFQKEVPFKKNEKSIPRLAECIAAEQSEIKISIDDIETFTKEEDWE